MKIDFTHLYGLATTFVEAEIAPYVVMDVQVGLNLGLVKDRLRSQLLLNLDRGHCSSLSGPAFVLYRTLSMYFNFPLFAMGRGGYMCISVPTGMEVKPVFETLKGIWLIANSKPDTPYYRTRFYCEELFARSGPKVDYRTWMVSRTKNMTEKAVCNALNVTHLRDLVSRDKLSEARSVVMSNETLYMKEER